MMLPIHKNILAGLVIAVIMIALSAGLHVAQTPKEKPDLTPLSSETEPFLKAKADFAISVHKEHNNTCYDCHGGAGLAAHRIVTEDKSCLDCHSTATLQIPRNERPAVCGGCHQQAVEDYLNSSHGKAFIQAGTEIPEDVPICADCHGIHEIQSASNSGSPASHHHSTEICGECHKDELHSFEEDYHELFYAYGDERWKLEDFQFVKAEHEIPVCVDCHGAHSVYPASHPNSTLNGANLDATCEKCHHFKLDRNVAKGYSHPQNFKSIEYVGLILLLVLVGFGGAKIVMMKAKGSGYIKPAKPKPKAKPQEAGG